MAVGIVKFFWFMLCTCVFNFCFCLRATVTSGVGGGMYTVDKKRVKRETKERVLNLLILS